MKNAVIIVCIAWILAGILPAHASLSFLSSTGTSMADFSTSKSDGIRLPLDFPATAGTLQFGSFNNEFLSNSIPALRRNPALNGLAEGLQIYVDHLPKNFSVLWMVCLESQSERNQGLSFVTSQWTKADPSAALNWIHKIQMGDEREPLLEASGERGDRLSARWTSSIETADIRERQVDLITSSWATMNLSTDSSWVMPIPEPQTLALVSGLFALFWTIFRRARNSSN
jgi:hypothetical protein